MKNYYAVLELQPTATASDIKRAWLEQLQVWHPDRFTHAPSLHRKAEARTQLINQAYQTLSDPAARSRYDATTHSAPPPMAPARPSPRPQPTARPRQESRGPRAPIQLARQGHPRMLVPAIQILVDSKEQAPYEFRGYVRIGGTTRDALAAGDYAIAEAPDLWRMKRTRVTDLYAICAAPSEHRTRFLEALDRLRAHPHRFLMIEGSLHQSTAGGRLGEYHKKGLMEFLDGITAKYGVQMLFAETREEAEERVANCAAMHYAYCFAEQQGLGRALTDDDL